MTTAVLTYSCNPKQVAISGAGSPSEVAIIFLVANRTAAPVSVAQIVLTLPQGTAATDLLAPGSGFGTGSVRSSDGSAWSLVPSGNQATLVPVSSQGYATLAAAATLQFPLTGITVNDAGAGSTAQVGVVETLENGAQGAAAIAVEKIASGFRIAAFSVDQYNVVAGAPVTVTWQVVGALSCSIVASIIDVDADPPAPGARCGVGTANPTCNGTIYDGTNLSGSSTCNIQGATLFTLTASGTGAGGDTTLTSQLLVTVNLPAINFTCFPPAVSVGQTVRLGWVSADAGKLQLYTVPAQGQPVITDLTATPVGSSTVEPLVNTGYTLYAFTNAGDSQPARQSSQNVAVEMPQWTTDLAATQVPTPAYPGNQATLNWAVANVASCNLACDQPGFVPITGLPATGPTQVTLPDPGVANATATFTMTPVQYGTLGDFTATTTTVPITNLPSFTQPLAANPATIGPQGGTASISWTVLNADTAVFTDTSPGSTPQPVNPVSGSQPVTLPATVIPTPVTCTLTVSRESGKYSTSQSVTVQGTGDITIQWCNSQLAGYPQTYLDTLYFNHPNQRLQKITLLHTKDYGVTGLQLWYSDAEAPDYGLYTMGTWDGNATLEIAAGDYVVDLEVWFQNIWSSDDLDEYTTPSYVSMKTAAGKSVSLGGKPDSNGDGPYSVSAPPGTQAIALAWNLTGSWFGGIGLVCCTTDYGA